MALNMDEDRIMKVAERVPIDLHDQCPNIRVDEVMNGFIVTIRCGQAVFTSYDDMLSALVEYRQDPLGTELKWMRASKGTPVTLQRDLKAREQKMGS